MKEDLALHASLISSDNTPPKDKEVITEPVLAEAEIVYREFGDEPKINVSGILLAVLPGLAAVASIEASKVIEMPILEYLFVVLLVAFVGNYWVIRKYELYPYLPNDKYDQQLKIACGLAFFTIIASVQWGWNNSGAILVAVGWELLRGNRMGVLGYGFLAAIVGSLMLEKNYSMTKLLEFIPGVTLGFITSTLYTLRESSPYSILHEFLLITTVFLPVCFPMQTIVKPSLLQWGVMILGGLVAIPTGLLIIRMMQKERVSISMTVFCSILMLLTSQYDGMLTFFGAAITSGAVLFILYHSYLANTETIVMV